MSQVYRVAKGPNESNESVAKRQKVHFVLADLYDQRSNLQTELDDQFFKKSETRDSLRKINDQVVANRKIVTY